MADQFDADAAYLMSALGMTNSAQIAAAARQVEAESAAIRAGGQVGAAEASAGGTIGAAALGLEGTKYGADIQEQSQLNQLLAQLGIGGLFGGTTETDPDTGEVTGMGATDVTNPFGGTITGLGSGTIGQQALGKLAQSKGEADAQKALAELQGAIQLGGTVGDTTGPTQGAIAKTAEEKRLTDMQQLQAQLGLGDDFGLGDGDTAGDYGTGIIGQTQAAQAQREKEMSKLAASQQLGTGDYAGTGDVQGGIIAAQSRARQAEEAQRAEFSLAAKLGAAGGGAGTEDEVTGETSYNPGDYRTLGELASQGIEQRLTQAQRAEEARANMTHHADLLESAQDKMATRLGSMEIPFGNMFGLNTPGGLPGGGDGGGVNTAGAPVGISSSVPPGANTAGAVGGLFQGADAGMQQTNAMNLLGGQNPFNAQIAAIPGMVGAGAGGAAAASNPMMAQQAMYNMQNQAQNAANQQFGQLGLTAAGNIGNQFNTQLSNKYAMQRPFAAAAGQAAGAIPQAYGQSLANMANIGIS